MKVCRDLCPVHKIQRCCFLCDEQETCSEVCPEGSNSLCELLIDAPDGSCETLAEPILKKLEVVLKQKAELENQEKELKESLKTLMEQHNETSLKNNQHFKVTYIKGSSTMVFNTDLFKKSCPDVYSKYCNKPKETKAYIKCEAVKKG